MKIIFLLLITPICIASPYTPHDVQSPYNLLRVQYSFAVPIRDVDSLKLGQDWYCTDEAAAANGVFKYVRLWKKFFNFQLEFGSVQNRATRGPDEFTQTGQVLAGELKFCDKCLMTTYALRINEDGFLMVEESVRRQKLDHRILQASKDLKGHFATRYFICRN